MIKQPKFLVFLNGNAKPGEVPHYFLPQNDQPPATEWFTLLHAKAGPLSPSGHRFSELCEMFGGGAAHNPFGFDVPMNVLQWHRAQQAAGYAANRPAEFAHATEMLACGDLREFVSACRTFRDTGKWLALYCGGPYSLPPLPGETSSAWCRRFISALEPYLEARPHVLYIDNCIGVPVDLEVPTRNWPKEFSKVVFGHEGGLARAMEKLQAVDGVRIGIEPLPMAAADHEFQDRKVWVMQRHIDNLVKRDWQTKAGAVVPLDECRRGAIIDISYKEFLEREESQVLDDIEGIIAAGHTVACPIGRVTAGMVERFAA